MNKFIQEKLEEKLANALVEYNKTFANTIMKGKINPAIAESMAYQRGYIDALQEITNLEIKDKK